MRRIVILSAFATPFRSGAEACAEEVAKRLNGRYDITMVTARMRRDLPTRDLLSGNVPLIRVGIGFGIDRWLYPFLAPFVARRLRPDIIHAVLESYAGLALVLCRFVVPRAKRMLTLQSTNTSFLLSLLHRYPHAITAISTVLVERAKMFGRHDVHVIPNGIALKDLEEARRNAHREGPPTILFVGRLEWMKGVDTLLHAFALLPSSLKDQTHLTIVGSGTLRGNLEALARELNVAHRVTFAGFIQIPQIYSAFAKADIFCALSRSEALGNVFLEAQAAGLAVIGTKVQGIPEVVKDGETGLLVPPDDERAAAIALEKLLTDQQLRMQLSEAGERNAEKYDWGVIAERYAEVYNQLHDED